jgi:hypothetical protein
VRGSAIVRGSARVRAGKFSSGVNAIQGPSRCLFNVCGPGMIAAGCEWHTFADWAVNGPEIMRKHGCPEDKIAINMRCILALIEIEKIAPCCEEIK